MRNKTSYKRAESAWDDTLNERDIHMNEVEKNLDNAMNGEDWSFFD